MATVRTLDLLAAAALAALPACGDNGNKPGAADMAVAAVDLARIPVDMAKMPVPTGGVSGVLRDEAGMPVKATSILACSATECQYGTTKDDGSFAVPNLKLIELAIKTEDEYEVTPKKAAALYPIKLTQANMIIDLKDIFVPTMTKTLPFSPTSTMAAPLALADGVTLTVVGKDLMRPITADRIEYIGAREVPAERRPPTVAIPGETVVASYAIMPFGTKSSSKIPVTVATKLAPGTVVYFRSISELDGKLSDPATGKEAQDGLSASTDPGQGITNLTWLVVSTK